MSEMKNTPDGNIGRLTLQGKKCGTKDEISRKNDF